MLRCKTLSIKTLASTVGLFFLTACLLGGQLYAQITYKTNGKIEDMVVLPGGYLLVGSGDGLEVIEAN